MERLTQKNKQNTSYYYPECFKRCDGIGASKKCDSCIITEKICESLGKYEELEDNGLLMIFPFKIGDIVYEISENHIEELTVEFIFIGDYTDSEGNKTHMAELHYLREDSPHIAIEIYFTDIGKNIFLSKEEALKHIE